MHQTKRVIVVCLLFLSGMLTSSTASASSFSILDTHNEVIGRLLSSQLGVSEHFDVTSTSSAYNKIVDADHPGPSGAFSFAEGLAAGALVSVSVDEPGSSFWVPSSAAQAISTILFRPNFNGAADPILFYGVGAMDGWIAAPKARWTITDVTSNTLVAVDGYNRGSFSQQLTYGTSGSGGSSYWWNSNHTYQLEMLVHTSSNHGSDAGWLGTNMFSVPEPSTLLLMSCGLAALIGLKKAQ